MATISPERPTGRQLIDEVVYLASLVSDPATIDPMLDTVRQITARTGSQPLSAADQASLEKVRANIENHLLTRDPVRAFTAETLKQQLDVQFGPRAKRRRSTHALIIVLIGSALLGSLPFVVGSLPVELRMQLVLPLFFLGTHTGIAWFFLSALANFQSTLRRAFGWIVLGEVLVGIVGSQLIIINLLGLGELPWFRYAGFMPLFTLAYIPLYVGLVMCARQLGLRGASTSVPLCVGLVLGLGAVAVVFPHPPPVTEEIFYDIAAASIAMCALIIGWCAWLALQIARHLTPLYARAMKFLGWSFGVDVAPLAIAAVILFATGQLQGAGLNLALSPFLIAEILLLWAGYSFKRVSD